MKISRLLCDGDEYSVSCIDPATAEVVTERGVWLVGLSNVGCYRTTWLE